MHRTWWFNLNILSLVVITALLFSTLSVTPVTAAPGDTTRVSVASDGTQGIGYSQYPSISADGRYVAFHSPAMNLVTGDMNGFTDVFVHDRTTGATTLLSVASDGTQGTGESMYPSISADGRYVAFHSDASSLVTGDTNSRHDIFVHDRTTGITTRVSVASDGTQGNNYSSDLSISADGRYVVFQSAASNLVSGDTNSADDVFVHDLTTGTTTRVSVDSVGTQGNNHSNIPSISADGRYVAFNSAASNLVTGDTNGFTDVFVHETDFTPPTVLYSTGTVPANNSLLTVGPTQIVIEYNKDVLADSSVNAANNTTNYLLVEDGADNAFTTLSCALPDLAGDTQITVNTAGYNNNGWAGPFLATLDINGGVPLPAGTYRLFVCGTTSVYNPASNRLNNGADSLLNFRVDAAAPAASAAPAAMPNTGFAPDRVTILPNQPADKTYAALGDLWLEIPRLGVQMPITGVPASGNTWDVSWLGDQAGWLEGTAFPTTLGNSVLTAHVWDAFNKPGVFYGLDNLGYDDQIIVHSCDKTYTYEVRRVMTVSPANVDTMLKHQEDAWLTLVTCKGYNANTREYTYRILVRAVLVDVR